MTTREGEGYAKALADFEAMAARAASAERMLTEAQALLAARETRIDELESDRARLAVERDHAYARRDEIETRIKVIAAQLVDAMREPAPRGVALQIPEAETADARKVA